MEHGSAVLNPCSSSSLRESLFWSLLAIILFQGCVSSVRRCMLSITVTTDDDSEHVDIAGGAEGGVQTFKSANKKTLHSHEAFEYLSSALALYEFGRV